MSITQVFSRTTRTLIADYGTTFAVAFFCAVPYMGDNYDLTPEKHGNETAATIAALKVPDTFETSSGQPSVLLAKLFIPHL